jgi:AraC-like DNA-binding protein
MRNSILISCLHLALIIWHLTAYAQQYSNNSLSDTQFSNYSQTDILFGRPFHDLYAKSNTLLDIRAVHEKTTTILEGFPGLQIHNNIIFARNLIKFGLLDEALNIVSNSEINYLNYNPHIRGEYFSFMGVLALRGENPEFSIKNHQKAIENFSLTIDSMSISRAYMNLGTAYDALKMSDSALFFLELAQEYTPHQTQNIYLKLNLAVNHMHRKSLETAKDIFNSSLDALCKESDYSAYVKTLSNLAEIYYLQDSLNISIDYHKKALRFASKYNLNSDKIKLTNTLSKIYSDQANFENAYHYRLLSDSLRSLNNLQALSQFVAEKNADNELNLTRLNEEFALLSLSKEKRFNQIIITAVAILIATLSALLLQFITLKKKNKLLVQKQVAKTKQRLDQAKEFLHSNPELLDKLNAFILDKKRLTDSNLTLEKLSKQLQTNRTYLSELINTHYGISFSAWLNEHRVNYACEIMLSGKYDHYSMDAIANLSGFTNISTFNTNFKKITGVTPSFFKSNRENEY